MLGLAWFGRGGGLPIRTTHHQAHSETRLTYSGLLPHRKSLCMMMQRRASVWAVATCVAWAAATGVESDYPSCEFDSTLQVWLYSVPGDPSSERWRNIEAPLKLRDSMGFSTLVATLLPQFLEICTSHFDSLALSEACASDLINQTRDQLVSACGPQGGDHTALEPLHSDSNIDGAYSTCATERPLVIASRNEGMGNVLGRWLTLAAIARSLGAPVITNYPLTEIDVHGGYDYEYLTRIVRFPCNFRFAADLSSVPGDRVIVNYSTEAVGLNQHPGTVWTGVNDYLPETAWSLLRGACDLGNGFPARVCMAVEPGQAHSETAAAPLKGGAQARPLVSRDDFLTNYSAVQRGLLPRVDLCNPPPGSYLAMHVRRRDRGASSSAPTRGILAVIARLQALLGPASLPWAVCGDSRDAIAEAEALLRQLGARVLVRERCGSEHDYDPEGAIRSGVSRQNTFLMARDFFLIRNAAGLVPFVPDFGESSFSSVAASAGDVPVLFCFERHLHLSAIPVWYEREGNGDAPMRGFHFAEHVQSFARAVLDPGHRYRPRRSSQAAEHGHVHGVVGHIAGQAAAPFPELPHIPRAYKDLPALVVSTASGDLSLKPAAAWPAVQYPCYFGEVITIDLGAASRATFSVNLRGLSSEAEAQQAAYEATVLFMCEEALKTSMGLEKDEAGSGQENVPRRNAVLTSRRLILKFCEAPEPLYSAAARIMGLVGEMVGEQCQ